MKVFSKFTYLILTLVLFTVVIQPTPVFAQDLPDEAFISGVVGHPQQSNLTCESRSAADWAAFMGVSVSEDEIFSQLPSTDNPEVGFVGNRNGTWGYIPPYDYGVHAAPIARVLRAYGLPAEERKGMTWDEARAEIAAGRPMIVWVIGGMWTGTPVEYAASDGQTTTVAAYEHSMMLIGYSASLVYVVDSYSGYQQTYYLSSFLNSWAVLGNMAVVATSNPENGSVTTGSTSGNTSGSSGNTTSSNATGTYTVQQGDTLFLISQKYGITWPELAEMNGISYPYVIYTGQILKVPGATAGSEAGSGETVEATAEPTVAPTATATPEASAEDTYIVQRGDYLVQLAREFGLNWLDLAELNGIQYPYVIHPGQVIRIR